jgi:hypothetical protein
MARPDRWRAGLVTIRGILDRLLPAPTGLKIIRGVD